MTMTFSTVFEDDWKESQKYTTLRCGDKTIKKYNPDYVFWLLYRKGWKAHIPFERTQQIAIGLGNLLYDGGTRRFIDDNAFNYLMEKFDAECEKYIDWGSSLER